ncbi:hypothetical protein NW757_014070 [Fusarium falciforme]|nr:hypothetical protein NW757_014070 [Fusarium falciforme]
MTIVSITTASSFSSSASPFNRPASSAPSRVANTTRSAGIKPATHKRKGPRSVSALSPSQLARKRANDREAQRAIRARTKEHIERLERELKELKSKQSHDQTVQELLCRNKALEEELMQLKENIRVSMALSPQSILVYDNNLSAGSDAISSPRGSLFPSDYKSFPDYNQRYVPLPHNCESWASSVPYPVPSDFSSPASSADDYSARYPPTSEPISILLQNNTGSSSISAVGYKGVIKMGYNVADNHGTIPKNFLSST